MPRLQKCSVGVFSFIVVRSDQSDSQYNLLHTMLGIVNIETSVSEMEQNILSLCKPVSYVKK